MIFSRSHHSLRFGTLSPEEIVLKAKQKSFDMIALTDINCMTGIYDFVLCCNANNVKPIVGMEFRNAHSTNFIGLAKNLQGFKELNTFLSYHRLNKIPLPLYAPAFEHVFVIYPFHNIPQKLKENEYVGVRVNEVNKLVRKSIPKAIAYHPVTFDGREGYQLHQLLRCVDQNILYSRLDISTCCQINEHFTPIDALIKAYEFRSELLKNTIALFDQCSFDFDFKSPKNKKSYTGNRAGDKELLTQLAMEGLNLRYGKNEKAKDRTLRELEIIDKLGFAAYFLITWDIIRYSNSRGFYHVGRGSGANSIIAYEIGLTDVCPLELNLYFERFLNPSRSSPPDFDIDWSWKERDEILKYVFNRYDKNKVAFTGTIGTFKHRSISQELGKVFGISQEERKIFSKTSFASLEGNSIAQKIAGYAEKLKGKPNLRSMHSCGILISEEDITSYMALEMPPKGFPTAQVDMYITDKINFEKLDLLSQRGIGHINDAVKLVKKNKDENIDIHKVAEFKKDPLCAEMLSKGQTLGCFYIESPAMRGLLRRLKCNNYPVLVAASSIIRPGVAKSGMMREYIYRHNGGEFNYLHPIFEEHLEDTHGVMVYQEDVLKVAHYFAGLDIADGDILRRAMSGKKVDARFSEVKERFFENCSKLGYSEELSKEIYRQLETFAGYSFCKAHSASYAVESYQSLYLKAHYPLEFIVAVINNYGGFYRTEVYIHEARMAGARIHNPCINNSSLLADIVGKDIYLGFDLVKNLSKALCESFIEEREMQGKYKSLENFYLRNTKHSIGIEQLETLIFIGAFRFTGKSKAELSIEARFLLNGKPKLREQGSLFEFEQKEFKLPKLEHSEFEDVFDEIQYLGCPVSKGVFDLLDQHSLSDVTVKDFPKYANKKVKIIGYLISRKPVPTEQGHMSFGTWIDKDGTYFDSIHFAQVLKKFPFDAAGCYLIEGKVEFDFDFPSIHVFKCNRLPLINDPRYENTVAQLPVGTRDNLPFTLGRAPYPNKKDRDKNFNQSYKSIKMGWK